MKEDLKKHNEEQESKLKQVRDKDRQNKIHEIQSKKNQFNEFNQHVIKSLQDKAANDKKL